MNEKKKIDVVVYKITAEEEQKIRNMFGKMNLDCEFKQALDENGNICKDGQVSFMKMPEDNEDPNNEIFDKFLSIIFFFIKSYSLKNCLDRQLQEMILSLEMKVLLI